MIKKPNTCSFSDIFVFAEKRFKVGWNRANDLFFNTILRYQGFRTLYREDMRYSVKAKEYEGDEHEARQIAVAFMDEHKVKELLVLGD